jgi:8-oxo-dGTP pyrophosphatase MutT (NUDIX family)
MRRRDAVSRVLLPEWASTVWHQFDSLRQQPTVRLSAGGIVVNRQGQLLLVYSTFADQGWHFPKGGLDEGETSLDAALKEIREEAGVEIGTTSLGLFDLGPGGGTFTEKLGFGSPRIQHGEIYNPVCLYFSREVTLTHGAHFGESISSGALELLRESARQANISESQFHPERYALFDAWREQPVCWRAHSQYHVLPFLSYHPELLSGESQRVEWWSLEQLRSAVKHHQSTIHRHVGRVLSMPELEEAIEQARLQAMRGGDKVTG